MHYPSTFPTLESKRLILRSYEEHDADSLFAIYSDPRITRFNDYDPITTGEEAVEKVGRNHTQFEEQLQIRWGIELKEQKRLVGTCGLCNFKNRSNKCTIGYDLLYAEWNKGIMTETIRMITAYAFSQMEIHRIEGYVSPENHASIKVLEKCGFQKEGLLRDVDFFKGTYQDGILLAKINSV